MCIECRFYPVNRDKAPCLTSAWPGRPGQRSAFLICSRHDLIEPIPLYRVMN